MKKNSKKVLMMGILVVIMIVIVTGVSLAFFNYTRTGSPNTLQVGRIAFNSTQTNIELENVFPTSSTNLNSSNSDTATITITGDTTYSGGIEYKVTLEAVNNTINNKEVPISIRATATNLGTEDSNYYTDRENKTNIYMLNKEGEAYNGKYIAVGYIPEGSTRVNGSINITAYIDTNKVAISDTYDGNETDLMGTTSNWVNGRTVFTTEEWNSFANTPLSFKVKVEANVGIWVEPEKFLTMKNLNSIQAWKDVRANITSIEFHKDGVAPANPVAIIDVTDTISDPSKGSITLYTVDDGLGNNTYKAIVVANDTIYAPEKSSYLFRSMTNMATFDSENFKVDNVKQVDMMFRDCSKLSNVSSLSQWKTSNIMNMAALFTGCKNIADISFLSNWDIDNVSTFEGFFNGCINLTNITPLANWKFSTTADSITFAQFFRGCASLTNINALLNWDVQNVRSYAYMFYGCSNLSDASGINDWNIIYPNARFSWMFMNTPVHPEFTKVAGTWDSEGTFTPNAS